MTSCPSCGIELGETTDEEGYPVYIDELLSQGVIYSPRNGYLKKI